MANLPEEIVTKVFSLQRQMLVLMDEAGAAELALFERVGETEETLPELGELQNIRERADGYYSRFSTVLRRIFDSQPRANRANLELLARTISEVQVNAEAMRASIEEVKRNWNLL
jgi:hypothetical protein